VSMTTSTRSYFVRPLKIALCAALLVAVDAAYGAFTMIEIITPSFGTFIGGVSGRQFILNTDGTIIGTDAGDYMFGALGGQLELKKTGGTVTANIVAENISTFGGLNVGSVLCQYHKDPQTTCSGSGINVKLQGKRRLGLGVDVTTTQFHGGGDTASVVMDITVTFL
jgi:hypothetical protein